MEKNNDMDIDNNGNTSPELSYETLQEKELWLDKVTKDKTNTRPPCVILNVDAPAQCVNSNHPTSTILQGSTTQSNESIFINI